MFIHRTKPCFYFTQLLILVSVFFSQLSLAATATDKNQNTVINIELAVDFNRDNQIELRSPDNPFKPTADTVVATEPYIFWINDDDDKHNSETSGNDTPGTRSSFLGFDWFGEYNYANNQIDGSRDLIDFFPVAINVNNFFDVIENYQDHTFNLKHKDSAVNVVFSTMDIMQSDAYLRQVDVNDLKPVFGDWQNHSQLHKVPVYEVSNNGVEVPKEFVEYLKDNDGKAVFLVEGRKTTQEPLVLEIKNKDNKVVLSAELPIKLIEVEDMYAVVNIRGAAYKDKDGPNNFNIQPHVQGVIQQQQAIISNRNLPDSFKLSKQFVFLHGFKVGHSGARAWHAEVFKRLFHSGSSAMYVGFSWDSNEGTLSGLFNYWGNVENALNIAQYVSQIITQSVSGDVTIAAHSLGNMVLSEAVTAYNLSPTRYFMLDPAVAIEAYFSTQLATVSGNVINEMYHPDWRQYHNNQEPSNPRRIFASDWYRIFPAADSRSNLKWGGKFENIFSQTDVYNFYSSGEEVLAHSDGSMPASLSAANPFGDLGQNAWIIQEKHKGLNSISTLSLGEEGGWGYNCRFRDKWWRIDLLCRTYEDTEPADAFQIAEADLRTHPFFNPFRADDVFSSDLSKATSAASQNKDHILAFGLPALSHPTGSTPILLDSLVGRNFNMNTSLKDGWPAERGPGGESERWFHSDAKDISYRYVYKLYDTWVAEGGLRD